MNFLDDLPISLTQPQIEENFGLDFDALSEKKVNKQKELREQIEKEKDRLISLFAKKVFDYSRNYLKMSFSDPECRELGKDQYVFMHYHSLDIKEKISGTFLSCLTKDFVVFSRWAKYYEEYKKNGSCSKPIKLENINHSLTDLGKRTVKEVRLLFNQMEKDSTGSTIEYRVKFSKYPQLSGWEYKTIPQSVIVYLWSKTNPPPLLEERLDANKRWKEKLQAREERKKNKPKKSLFSWAKESQKAIKETK